MDRFFSSYVFKHQVTDHYLIFTSFESNLKGNFIFKKFRDHSQEPQERFNYMVCDKLSYDAIVDSYSSLDDIVLIFNTQLYQFYIEACPIRTKYLSVSRLINPWLNKRLVELIQFKHFLSAEIAKVVPIFKSGEHDKVENYRPISILPLLSKVFEKLIYVRLIKFLGKHNIINNN